MGQLLKQTSFIPLFFILFSACSFLNSGNSNSNNYPNAGLMADVQWLQENLNREDLRIVDLRTDGFEKGHIPGSVNIEGANALVDESNPIANFLMTSDQFADLMSRNGIGNNHTVVIYDEGNSLHASRLFYALELYGHQDVKILNGGFAAWRQNNGEISTTIPSVEPAVFRAEARDGLVCDISYVQQNIGNDNVVFYDARSLEEYEGRDVRAQQSGHIPGAVHLEWSESVEDEGIPYFKTKPELEKMLADKGITPDKEIIPHCQSNVRGSHVYFMLRLMGYDSVRPYEGSWSEYGNTDGVPIVN